MIPDIKWLENPRIFQVNRLDAHSDHVCYPTVEEAASGQSSLRQSLNGEWMFQWSKNPASRPADFWQEGFDLSGFGTIQVPGHMETQGYDVIHYINKLYPWDGHDELRPPQIPWERNPVGSYVKEFDLEPGLVGKPVCISFQGVEQAVYVWLNGHFVGYAEDSFTPSDFDLTPYIRETGNRLCVQVHKLCSGAWMEDQDFFRFSGIFRPVFLYAKPITEDIWIQTALNRDNASGTLRVRMKLAQAASVTAKVSHPTEGVLFEGQLELHEEDGYFFSQTISFDHVKPWNYGTPELYDVLLTVSGSETEFIPYRTGFRRVEIGQDKVMYVNGKRLIINGVNRHEWSPLKGRAIGQAEMEAALATILENKINAVRTCHYPNQSAWYHLCDEKGIYLMDEANLESHGTWQKDHVPGTVEPSWNIPGSLPEWHDALLDRANNMFQRDKNHVSILFWSCGNESFCGTNIVDEANFFRAMDPSRLVHYEGLSFTRGTVDGKPTSPHWDPLWETASDIESRMYATPWDVRQYLENDPPKPYILCEYMHNMGNSLGGMESYVSMAEEFPMYQGGFIWDFMDQAIVHTNVNGETVLGYGGDFDDRQCDYNFSGNGLVDAFGNPKPCMQEVRFWHSLPEVRKAHMEANEKALAQIEMPQHPAASGKLAIAHGDGSIGVKTDRFEILFSRSQSGPASIRVGGTEWIWRGPRPAFWRAPTENDIGCGFPLKAAIWAGVDAYQSCVGEEVLCDSEDKFSIRYSFGAKLMPDLRADVTYTITPDGALDVAVKYFGAPGRPQLPLFGLRFATAKPVVKTTWAGLSGETYPDRYKGGVVGIHEEVPHIPNYLVPQECCNHMNTHWAKLACGEEVLTIEKLDAPFHFSAIPYTPRQLEEALHVEELPKSTRTVVTVCGAMRGVGGIDTWGSDVEEAYHVLSDRDQEFNFRIHI